MPHPVYVSGISQQLGSLADLAELKDEGVSDDELAALREKGFKSYLRESRAPAQVWSECASAAITACGIPPANSLDIRCGAWKTYCDTCHIGPAERSCTSRARNLGRSWGSGRRQMPARVLSRAT
jgi:hypothetical protein